MKKKAMRFISDTLNCLWFGTILGVGVTLGFYAITIIIQTRIW